MNAIFINVGERNVLSLKPAQILSFSEPQNRFDLL